VALEIHHSIRHCSVCQNNQHGIQRQGQDFDKKFVFEGVHSKEVDSEFSEKSQIKRGDNKLLKKFHYHATFY